MDLRHLTDKVLLADTKLLVARERELSTKILNHLKEIDRRKLYSDLGYTSLFDYCLRELGYTESSAFRRIQAARLLKDLPIIETKIENGSLSLSNLSLLNQFFKENALTSDDQKLEVIGKIENLSTRDCEKELFKISGKQAPETKDKKRRISQDKSRYSITLTDKTSETLDKVKGLINKNLSLDELIQFMAKKQLKFLKRKNSNSINLKFHFRRRT